MLGAEKYISTICYRNMEGEPLLKKASITQRQIGLHCLGFPFHCLGIDLTLENQLHYEASDRAPASRNQAASPLSRLTAFCTHLEDFATIADVGDLRGRDGRRCRELPDAVERRAV